MRLQIEKGAFVKEFRKVFYKELKESQNFFKEDVKSCFGTNLAISSGEIYTEIQKEADKFIMNIDANTEALMDIFGTGSKMNTTDNPLLDEYISSDKWNSYRSKSDTTIRGRKAGSYTDVFGNQRESSGNLAGYDIEGMTYTQPNGGYIKIEAQEPSDALNNGIKKYCQDALLTVIENTVNKMDLAKCMEFK